MHYFNEIKNMKKAIVILLALVLSIILLWHSGERDSESEERFLMEVLGKPIIETDSSFVSLNLGDINEVPPTSEKGFMVLNNSKNQCPVISMRSLHYGYWLVN
jgi:hypothetical protein